MALVKRQLNAYSCITKAAADTAVLLAGLAWRRVCGVTKQLGEPKMTLAEELIQLEQMRERGSLSETEFAQAKARLLQPPPMAALSRIAALKGLRRSAADRWLGGICGGLAAFTGVDTWLWRLAFTLLLLLGGSGLVVYMLIWILVPLEFDGYSLPMSSDH